MSDENSSTPYRVLARKYRPSTFDELIGHEAMVKTLSNALDSGRLAHAFVLTGTRGIGKTTTARIIARGLNCIGEEGTGGPTIAPCGVCTNCVAIAEDRHQDVLEMDAASRTGVDDIRELIDGVRYLPVAARFKIYIIDEVHMLSKNAFNALLKTLEEPPEHVKFIFATTEIRKIPVTVLSRCQRFDLKHVDGETLSSYFATIAEKEKAEIEPDALALIARSAEGSVRDGLSLLDQAIAHGDGAVSALQVRDMLGLADRTQILDLLGLLMSGEIQKALGLLRSQYDSGADPIIIIQDLLELTHWLTALKVTPEAANNVAMSGGDAARGQELSAGLSMPVLARTWQMLLKGLDEVRKAPMSLAAAEMVLVRIAYVSDLPSPEELAKQLDQRNDASPAPAAAGKSSPSSGPAPVMVASTGASAVPQTVAPVAVPDKSPRAHLSIVAKTDPALDILPVERIPEPVTEKIKVTDPQSLEDIIDLLSERQDIKLKAEVANFMRLVKFEEGLIEFSPTTGASPDLAAKLGLRLREITDGKWVVKMSAAAEGAPTIAEKRRHDKAEEISALENHPMVRNIQTVFPGATIREVRNLGPTLDSSDVHIISEEDEFD
ncbi:DNA polymerase III subunit gamma/tau [Sneathiella marina]|uniref:DNA polymerase III subunit gamma/tau n=1 Tax=Sneathiella marina TaxID=2950108 RepID=A0ABY4W8Z1_9PROT|nr:DNA polymerase III subunit gamma/tau [Sneathiella marina]USG61744.1 DNA polymerase III subunit gamma/tau [Sneathiella marina]